MAMEHAKKKLAVLMFYQCDQNEPSQPNALVWLPTGKKAMRAAMLEAVEDWADEIAKEDADDDDLEKEEIQVRLPDDNDQRQWIWSYCNCYVGHGGKYALFTFVKLPEEKNHVPHQSSHRD